MKHTSAIRAILSIVAVTLFCASPALAAQPKPRKPAVCASYEKVDTRLGKALICLDGIRPSVWTGGYIEVTVGGQTFAVGFRSAK